MASQNRFRLYPLPGRRRLLQTGLLTLAAPLAPFAQPTAWPTRPISLIVPWPAGGGTDLTFRILADEAGERLGQPVNIINRPGAAGTLVAPLLKMAAPDGYTIGQLPITVFRYALMYSVAWDPIADLTPILQISGTTFGLLVPSSSPWNTLEDMLRWARSRPNELLMGSTGIGTTAHLAMEEIMQDRRISYTHIPYKGTTDQMLALLNGTLMAGVNSTGFAPWVDQGKLRLLAIFSAQRSAKWPDVPTLRELGFKQAIYTSPWGLAAPSGTDRNIIQTLHGVFRQATHSARHIAELARYDQEVAYLDTTAYRQAIALTVQHEKELLTRMNLLGDRQKPQP
jgi:tripartite-type tricarboxylate transporter receptor subunit TctC